MTQAETDILAEREKQRQKWGDEHDDKHTDHDLAPAASIIAYPEATMLQYGGKRIPGPTWAHDLRLKHRADRRKQLVIAAALLIADVERMDRADAASAPAPAPTPRQCNQHDDCDAADADAQAKGKTRPHHCRDDECPDCFGD